MRGVMKIGGSTFDLEGPPVWEDELRERVGVGDQVVLVHGGGAIISRELARLGEAVEFIDGQRVTSPTAMEVVAGVLRGRVNAELVAYLGTHGLDAVGLSGVDGQMMAGDLRDPRLGRVGRVTRVDPRLIETIWAFGAIPVVAPLAFDARGELLNVNGDTAAGAIAAAVGADWLVYYTDSGGVRREASDPATRVARLRAAEAESWIREGRAQAGMIPKLESGLAALRAGVRRVVIGALAPGQGTDLEIGQGGA